jgi:hypothetical protein
VNATWIDAKLQPNFWLIGIVKSVPPAVLKVCNHHHADAADYELVPTGGFGNPLGRVVDF